MTERGKHARPGRWRVYAEGAVAAGAVGVLAVSLSGGSASSSGRVITETNLHEAGSVSIPSTTLVPGSSGRTISEPAPALALASHTSPTKDAAGTNGAQPAAESEDSGGDQSDSNGHGFGSRSGGQRGGDSDGSADVSTSGSGTTATVGASTGTVSGGTVTTTPNTRPPSYGGTAPTQRSSYPTTTTWPAQPATGGDGAGGYLNGVGLLSGMTPGYAPVYSYSYGYVYGY